MAHTATARGARTARARRSKRTSPSKPKGSGLERFRGFLKGGGPGANSYVVLLGLYAFEPQKILSLVEQGLPYGAFERLLANTSLASDAAIALVNIPQRTLTRRKREGRFRRDESDRLVRASRVFARALGLFEGDRDAAKHWLSEPQKALGDEAPLMIARTEVGALEVERLIGRLEHGVFT